MSDEIRFRVNARGKNVADEIEDAIEQGIKDAVGKSSKRGLDDAILDAAKDKIRDHDRKWRGTLLESFDVRTYREGDDYILVVENDAEHARTTEYGRTPGEEKPPLAALIPWVEAHLDDWDVDPEY